MLLGCVADDFTGASDLANTLAKQGMRTVQFSGIPDGHATPDCEAAVVALKTRSAPPREAVEQSIAPCAVVCPVFPTTGRTLFMGHLFVGNRLLNESGMQNHPLNPMTDPDIYADGCSGRPRFHSIRLPNWKPPSG